MAAHMRHARGSPSARTCVATPRRHGRLFAMSGRGLNGTSGGTKRKRAKAPKRHKRATKAQVAAMRRIVAESGVKVRPEEVDAILQELRR
jgi:hypothetical protein